MEGGGAGVEEDLDWTPAISSHRKVAGGSRRVFVVVPIIILLIILQVQSNPISNLIQFNLIFFPSFLP